MSVLKTGIIKTSDNKLLLNNFTKSNTLDNWNFGNTTKSLSNGILTVTGTSPSFTTDYFSVKPDDLVVVEFQIEMTKKSNGSDGLYFGIASNSNTIRYNYNTTTKKWDSGYDNASEPWGTYFVWGYNTVGKFTATSYILGSNVDINDVPKPLLIGNYPTIVAIKLKNFTSTCLRAAYNSGNTEMIISFKDINVHSIYTSSISTNKNYKKIGKDYLSFNDFIEY